MAQSAAKKVRTELYLAGSTLNHSLEAKIRGFLSKALLNHAQSLVKGKHKLNLQQTVATASVLFGWDQKQTTHNHLDFFVGARLKPKTPQPVVNCGVQDKPVIDITPQDSVSD